MKLGKYIFSVNCGILYCVNWEIKVLEFGFVINIYGVVIVLVRRFLIYI